MSCNSRPEPTSEKNIKETTSKKVSHNQQQSSTQIPTDPWAILTGHQALAGHRVQAHVQGLRGQVLRPPTARDSPGIRKDPQGLEMEFVHLFHGEITPNL
jgi:hypothetical protein